jgi:hypothetical protein
MSFKSGMNSSADHRRRGSRTERLPEKDKILLKPDKFLASSFDPCDGKSATVSET